MPIVFEKSLTFEEKKKNIFAHTKEMPTKM